MADKKISALTSATTPLAGTEVLPIVQSSSTVKVPVSSLTSGREVEVAGLNNTANIRMNTTNAAWRSSARAIDVWGFGAFSGDSDNLSTAVSNNYYRNSSGVDTYKTAYFATQYQQLTGTHVFRVAPSSSGAITWTTALSIANNANITVNTGNLVVGTAGKGIDFSANTNAPGMTSELLTWYEEGTWTPSLRGSSTAGTYELATASGWYTRIGRQVTAMFDIKLDAAITGGGTGFLCIAGLPFNAATTAATVGSCVLSGVGFSASAAYVVITPRGVGSPQIILQDIYANAGSGAVDVTTLAANDILQGTLTYLA